MVGVHKRIVVDPQRFFMNKTAVLALLVTLDFARNVNRSFIHTRDAVLLLKSTLLNFS